MVASCYSIIKAGIRDTYHNKPWHFKTFTEDKSKIPMHLELQSLKGSDCGLEIHQALDNSC